jgi:hypothetical protein
MNIQPILDLINGTDIVFSLRYENNPFRSKNTHADFILMDLTFIDVNKNKHNSKNLLSYPMQYDQGLLSHYTSEFIDYLKGKGIDIYSKY